MARKFKTTAVRIPLRRKVNTLRCIREVLRGFSAESNFEGYTTKQYAESLKKINDLLIEVKE